MLFALPFAAVGVGALVWSGSDAARLAAHAAAGLPCRPKSSSVELEEHDGRRRHHVRDDGHVSLRATAAHDYTGTRVAIDSGADNIGDFQQRPLRTSCTSAHAAAARRSPPTSIPTNPADAVLNRELRWPLLAIERRVRVRVRRRRLRLLFGARYGAKKLA